MNNSTSAVNNNITIEDAIMQQTPTIDGWICPGCKNHEGGVTCKKGVFIAYTQANTSGCWYYDEDVDKVNNRDLFYP